jgi:hypothetical protein
MATRQKIQIDKEELKRQFDVSHFDLNAVLRGIQLTLVGGEFSEGILKRPPTDDGIQPTAPSRTLKYLQTSITSRQPMPWPPALASASSLPSLWVVPRRHSGIRALPWIKTDSRRSWV